MLHVGAIQTGKIAFSKTQVVYGIQQVGFAYAILTADPNDPFFKIKRPVAVVFELNQ